MGAMNFARGAAACLALVFLGSAAAAEPKAVRVGIVNASSDVGFFIADQRGYFRDEGLAVTFTQFDSAAKMVVPLSAGQLDVGGGSPSAGLYNGLARGFVIKIVADKGSTPPGHGYQPLLVRKDLVDSGRYKQLKDLKGMKIAGSAAGSASTSTFNEILKKAGLNITDVERVHMGFPQHVLALQNKALDAALTTEPSATRAVQSGAAVRVIGDDEAYPNHQLAVVLYSGEFAKTQAETAQRFMRAYLRGVRDYNDVLRDGHIAGPGADAVIAILTSHTSIKDPAIYRAIISHGSNPDGKVNEASLRKDLQFFKDEGLIKGSVTVDQALDHSFVDAAVRTLGPYRQNGGAK